MRVNGLDHVNIRVNDIDAAARFYSELLDLKPGNVPAPIPPEQAQWLHDHNGQPIVHLFKGESESGSTGAIHHVAFSCTGKEDLLARLRAMGAEYQVHDSQGQQLTQIFTRDPHGIMLELNVVNE